MRYFIKAQSKSNFRNIPLGLFQQYLGFFSYSAIYDFCGTSTRSFL